MGVLREHKKERLDGRSFHFSILLLSYKLQATSYKLQATSLELFSWSLATDRIAQGFSIESLSLQ